jgi:HK97 family phage prohead protease
MRAELRADGLHISGYVNVPGRQSRPVMTPYGRVIEVIEQRAFARAIERAGNIRMLLDHDPNRVLAETENRTLTVKEDAVGLRAESVITDPEVIAGAKSGKLRGWSFNIRNPKDTLEQRAEGLPVRHIMDLDMDEITLVMNKIPAYSSTSIEVRADTEDEEAVELRTELDPAEEIREEPEPEQKEPEPEPQPKPQYHESYNERIRALK